MKKHKLRLLKVKHFEFIQKKHSKPRRNKSEIIQRSKKQFVKKMIQRVDHFTKDMKDCLKSYFKEES